MIYKTLPLRINLKKSVGFLGVTKKIDVACDVIFDTARLNNRSYVELSNGYGFVSAQVTSIQEFKYIDNSLIVNVSITDKALDQLYNLAN